MKLLSRWFRRPPMAPSWIEPTALATWLERDDAPLIVDVRGPDEFSGPLGHIREATNIPLVELPAHFPIWFVRAGLSSWSAKQTVDHPWRRTSCRRPVCLMCRYCVAGWNGGECLACRQTEKCAKGNNSYPSISLSTRQPPSQSAHRNNSCLRAYPWQ